MLKLTQVTVTTTGEVTVRGISLPSVDHAVLLAHVGTSHGELCKMDSIREEFVHGQKTVTIILAQERPWTYITHTFVQSK